MLTSKSRYIVRLFNKINPVCSKNLSLIHKIHLQQTIPIVIQKPLLYNFNLQIIRSKHKDAKKGKKKESSESEDDEPDNFEMEIADKQTKVISVKLNSLRADLILKAGLGIARNKIENMFYESKIRVNGQKLMKKSAMLSVGDEIDIVRGSSLTNPDFLTVSRVEILSATEKDEGLGVRLRRNKALTIENYDK